MMMTSSIQKLWSFCQPVFLEFPMCSIETYRKKETAVNLKRIDRLPQHLARIHILVGYFDRTNKNSNFLFFLFFPLFPIVCVLSIFCSKFDIPLEVQDVE